MNPNVLFISIILAFTQCQAQQSKTMEHQHTNSLINSTSPYLLQHAHNPVNWHQWSEDLVEQAKKENKLLLISIGYAACHWCHVMEHESFEDEQVAQIMNDRFICIKVDREERPDVDHYYMTAVQLMQQQGGWPLNVIALPDGRPFWGGTYFSKENWVQTIMAVADYYHKNPQETVEYAGKLEQGINQVSMISVPNEKIAVTTEMVQSAVNKWKKVFDTKLGGRLGKPKFPMPVTLDFLLYYGHIQNDQEVLDYVSTTLTKMAFGGIYDQIGGGFARYSVDEKWKVPHFEKMLYDNGQLLSLYSKGYQLYKNPDYKKIVYETVEFLQRELMDHSGAFYSSLDADSEGEEGKFYVWSKEELQTLLGADFNLFADYYNVNSKGFWEHGNYILLKDTDDKNFALKNSLSEERLEKLVLGWKTKLLKERTKRVRPGLDDKTLTSWNVLAIQGLVDAYKTFGEKSFLDLAEKNARFIIGNQMDTNGHLFHNWKKGVSSIDGFMEDYALSIQAFISLFEITGNQTWLEAAQKLVEYSFSHFYDREKQLFYFSSKNSSGAITNHFQNEDNVIPAANSVMANNLFKLYLINGKPEYLSIAKNMLYHVSAQFENYPMAYANWGSLMLKLTEPYFEVAVCGEKSEDLIPVLQKDYSPNTVWAASVQDSKIPLLQNRFVEGKTFIYVCQEGVCQLPVEKPEDALNLIK